MVGHTRRRLLQLGGVAAGTPFTGCLDGGNLSPSDSDAVFEAQVSFPVIYEFTRNVVPKGAEAENLVPTGQHGHGWQPSPDIQRAVTGGDAFVYVFEGFQPWADDIITSLERDHPEVAVVEAGKDVELLEVGENSHGHDGDSEGGNHDSGEEGDEHDNGHDHGGNTNPHFWLDPLRAKTAVDNVADGLAEADDGTDGYRGNADEYMSTLDDLHAEFESSLSDASKDAVLVAGHDAFAYLGERYGFRVETLTGVSPDEQPSPEDIERAQELIDSEGIEYVLAPVFESDTAAQSLVEDTSATDGLPITSFAGFSQEWVEDGWGYVEVMRNVNLSSLERALDA